MSWPRYQIFGSGAGSAILYVCIGLGLCVAMTAFWIRAALMNMSNPLYSAFAMEQVDERARARVSSLMGMGWNIGWSVGPYISGLMQVRVGFGPIFMITAGAYLVGSIITYALFAKSDPIPIKHKT